MKSLEEVYGIVKIDVQTERRITKSGKELDVFNNPNPEKNYLVSIEFPEFTCLCPKTHHPDFATITLRYIPDKVCIELKSLKYLLNSYRSEGHFHEEVVNLIADGLVEVLDPRELELVGEFNVRGGTYPVVNLRYTKDGGWKV